MAARSRSEARTFVEMKGGSLVFTSVRRRKASKICLHPGNGVTSGSLSSRRADITRFDERSAFINALRQWLLPECRYSPRTPARSSGHTLQLIGSRVNTAQITACAFAYHEVSSWKRDDCWTSHTSGNSVGMDPADPCFGLLHSSKRPSHTGCVVGDS